MKRFVLLLALLLTGCRVVTIQVEDHPPEKEPYQETEKWRTADADYNMIRVGDQALLYTWDVNAPAAEDMVCVPDVRGLSMVDASRVLRARGLQMELAGSGLAVKQTPAAGAYAPPGTKVKVQFEFSSNGEIKNVVE